MKRIWATTATLLCLLGTPAAHAGFLEDLLARPAIQTLLGRQPELQVTLKNCGNAAFKQRNLAGCTQAEQAAKLAAMPVELRAVMSGKASSASLRELCLVAQPTPAKDSYLCAELFKADSAFKAEAEQAQRNAEQVQRAKATAAGAESPN